MRLKVRNGFGTIEVMSPTKPWNPEPVAQKTEVFPCHNTRKPSIILGNFRHVTHSEREAVSAPPLRVLVCASNSPDGIFALFVGVVLVGAHEPRERENDQRLLVHGPTLTDEIKLVK